MSGRQASSTREEPGFSVTKTLGSGRGIFLHMTQENLRSHLEIRRTCWETLGERCWKLVWVPCCARHVQQGAVCCWPRRPSRLNGRAWSPSAACWLWRPWGRKAVDRA